MKKQLFIAAAALLALAGCSDDSFVGDQSLQEANGSGGAIGFTMSTPRTTRAEGADAAAALNHTFKVYGVKKVGSDYSNVFATETYSDASDYDANPYAYWVWYAASTAGTTASDTKDWDYVGATGTNHGTYTPTDHHITLTNDQTIKYWDYSADQYEFVAYSATVTDATTPYSITKYQKDGFTITATAEELAGLYVADKLTISTKDAAPNKPANDYNKIGDIVKFTFRSSAAKVRLGIYETIPGYVVKNVKFRPNASEFTSSTTNAILSGSFNGTSSSIRGTYNVTYNETNGIAEFNNTAGTADKYFDFGSFASGTSIGETSTTPTWAGAIADPSNAPYYQSVLPNTDHEGNMILYVDYDLYNETSGETIHVYGAKAVVPSMYMEWNPNYAYTYLFKISDNTNGQTKPGTGTPVGLFPITFDAVTVATTDGTGVGTITTVSAPAITTYQEGSVSSAGITYATASETKPIYITVNTDGTLADLSSSNTKLYTVNAGTTEADLMLGVSTTEKTGVTSGTDVLSIPSSGSDETVQGIGITFTGGKYAKFTPVAPVAPATVKTYAVEYETTPAVPESWTEIENLTEGTSDVTGLFEKDGDNYNLTEDVTAQTGKKYYRYNPAIPAGKQYKVIVVQ